MRSGRTSARPRPLAFRKPVVAASVADRWERGSCRLAVALDGVGQEMELRSMFFIPAQCAELWLESQAGASQPLSDCKTTRAAKAHREVCH